MIVRNRRLDRFVLAILAVWAAVAVGCGRDTSTRIEPSGTNKGVKLAADGEPAVELVIDYGDGVEKRLKQIPYHQGMSVQAALHYAAEHPRGITFEKKGEGEMAFLTRIDNLSNQGAGDGRNWLYRVNDKPATKSFDAYVLSPGDVILWKYEAGSGIAD